jgi:hypothetical protein
MTPKTIDATCSCFDHAIPRPTSINLPPPHFPPPPPSALEALDLRRVFFTPVSLGPTGFRSARAKLGCRDRSPAQRERRLIERLLLLDMELIYARFTIACTKWRGATGDCNRPCVEIVVDVEMFVQRLHEDRHVAQFSTFHVL